MTRRLGLIACAVVMLLGSPARAMAEDALRVELNTMDTAQNRCRTSFLIENKGDHQIESLKLDLVIFGTENTMQRRMIVEVGPIRRAKTIIRSYDIERDCAQIGAILVNDVAACAPGEAGACLDALALSSRVPNVRFFK